MKKPKKMHDTELYTLIEEKLKNGQYIFVSHAKLRLKQRAISQLDVINILKGREGFNRKRNKAKDLYEPLDIMNQPQDWKYCIEGTDIDGKKIRIILTFDKKLMPIITVIRI